MDFSAQAGSHFPPRKITMRTRAGPSNLWQIMAEAHALVIIAAVESPGTNALQTLCSKYTYRGYSGVPKTDSSCRQNQKPEHRHTHFLWNVVWLKHYVTPCSLKRWCKAYNQPKAASPRAKRSSRQPPSSQIIYNHAIISYIKYAHG
jgi:hypothetical protein